FLCVAGKQSGPFSPLNVHEMRQLGSIPSDALVWYQGQPNWLLLDEFLARHPINRPVPALVGRAVTPKSPSRLRGLAGALLASLIGGALIAGFTALTGALFTIFWWALGWASGTVAKRWARTYDQILGLFAFGATLLGIFISGAGLEVR